VGTKLKPAGLKAMLHTERSDLRSAMRAELKAIGVTDVVTPTDSDACIVELVNDAEIPLVIDWELGGEEVVKVLSAARGHFKIDTRPIFVIARRVDENVLLTAWEYGVSHVHTGEISRARIKEALRKLIATDAMPEREIRETLIKVAEARKRDEWGMATPLLLEMTDKYPDNHLLKVELAENFIFEELWSEAGALVQPLAMGEPPNPRALHLYARCLAQSGKLSQATRLLQKAKLINPHNVERLIDLGNILLHQNRVGEARDVFTEAEAKGGDNQDAVVGKSKCMLLEGEVNEALAILKDISGPRELAAIFNTTAILAIHHGTFEKGMSLYDAAVRAVGKNTRLQARLWFNKGVGYRRWRRSNKALECFTRSLALDAGFDKAKRQRAAVAGGAKVRMPARGALPEIVVDNGPTEEVSEIEFPALPKRKTQPEQTKKAAGADTFDGAFEEEDWSDDDL